MSASRRQGRRRCTGPDPGLNGTVQGVGGVHDYSVGIPQQGSVGSLLETSRPEMAFTKWARSRLWKRRKHPYYYSFAYEYVRPHQTTR